MVDTEALKSSVVKSLKGLVRKIPNPDLHPGRVMQYHLNPTMDRIERREVLESYNPLFEVPTTGIL